MRGYITMAVVLACAAQAYAIEPYKAQDIQPYRAQDIQPSKPQDIQPYRASEVQPYRSAEVQPSRARDIEPDRAKQSRGYQPAQPKPYPAQEVKQDASAAAGSQRNRLPEPAPARQAEGVAASTKLAGANLQTVLGIWQTNIPGAVYTTPSGIAGYDTLHVSTGAAAGLLRINSDGTYSWNSYGGKKGKWVKTGDPEYPVEIIDTVENRRWKVGYSAAKKTLMVWSGSFWYEGRKAAVRKR